MAAEKLFVIEIEKIIFEALATAPSSQLSKKLKKEYFDFKARPYTLQQAYDFCNYISKQPEMEASRFVKTLCDVEKYYQRPK